MIVLALILLAAAPVGPAMRLGPMTAEGAATVEIFDRDGRLASRVACPANPWTDPRDSARALMASPVVMAHVIATDGRLENLEQLGPVRYACVIVPAQPEAGA
jgi:hypothetical protein